MATLGLGRAPRNLACGAVSCRCRTCCDESGTGRSGTKSTLSTTALRGHYAYYGIAGNFRSLQKVHRAVERYWHKMLCSRSWAGRITWDVFHQIKQRQPILRPKLYLPYRELQALAVL